MKVINLWAGPGAGKSSVAAGLFHAMKFAGKKVELVQEYAKELVYENKFDTLSNQRHVLLEQDWRQRRLIGQVDYVITDSPLPLALLYAKPPYDTEEFRAKVMRMFHGYDNANFYIDRVKPYAAYGRYQSEDEAFQLDVRTLALLGANKIKVTSVKGDEHAHLKIMEHLFG